MRPHPGSVATVVALTLGLAGCGGSGEPDGTPTTPSPSASASADAKKNSTGDGSGVNAGTITITFSGDSVDPAGERVEVEVGSEVVLDVTADAPGSLHVHTTPEQEIHYGKGTTSAAVSVDQPGVIEVESHDLGIVVLQLEAR